LNRHHVVAYVIPGERGIYVLLDEQPNRGRDSSVTDARSRHIRKAAARSPSASLAQCAGYDEAE
jgi:hypothetical protein